MTTALFHSLDVRCDHDASKSPLSLFQIDTVGSGRFSDPAISLTFGVSLNVLYMTYKKSCPLSCVIKTRYVQILLQENSASKLKLVGHLVMRSQKQYHYHISK